MWAFASFWNISTLVCTVGSSNVRRTVAKCGSGALQCPSAPHTNTSKNTSSYSWLQHVPQYAAPPIPLLFERRYCRLCLQPAVVLSLVRRLLGWGPSSSFDLPGASVTWFTKNVFLMSLLWNVTVSNFSDVHFKGLLDFPINAVNGAFVIPTDSVIWACGLSVNGFCLGWNTGVCLRVLSNVRLYQVSAIASSTSIFHKFEVQLVKDSTGKGLRLRRAAVRFRHLVLHWPDSPWLTPVPDKTVRN